MEIFTDNWMNTPTLNDGEKLVKIATDNPIDELYAIINDTMDDPDEELAFALRKKFGRTIKYGGYEDVSWMCDENE